MLRPYVTLFKPCQRLLFRKAIWPLGSFFNPSLFSYSTKSIEELRGLFEPSSQSLGWNSDLNENIKVIGWVQSIRRHKSLLFVNIIDGTSPYDLQIVISPGTLSSDQIVIGSGISAEGYLRPLLGKRNKIQLPSTSNNNDYIDDNIISSNNNNNSQCSLELYAQNIKLLKTSNSSTEQLKTMSSICTLGRHSPRPDLGVLRSSNALCFRHRLPEFSAMLRIRSKIKNILRKVMDSLEYLEVDTPILTTLDCEGLGQMFKVSSPITGVAGDQSPNDSKPISHNLFLTGSAQLHLEALSLGLSKVYTLSPTFRAENSHTRYHLAEFHMLEAESVYVDNVDDLCTEIESIVRMFLEETVKLFLSPNVDNQKDLMLIRSILTTESNTLTCDHDESFESCLDKLQSLCVKQFVRLTYHEALDYLNRDSQSNVTSVKDLTKFEENQILQWVGCDRPVFITHFPLSLKPYYCQSRDELIADCTDLLMPGLGELVGASVRETDSDRLRARLESQHISSDTMDWYLGLGQIGTVAHSGFGLGFERFVQYVLGIRNIRDTICFPRTCDKIVY